MSTLLSRRTLLMGATALALPRIGIAAEGMTIPVGKSGFPYKEPMNSPYAGIVLPVHTYCPHTVNPKTTNRILFVMHGTLRNGSVYRDQWIAQAEKYRALILVPEFTRHDFPGGMYNRGNVRGEDDETTVPENKWTFPIIERLFDYVKATQQNPIKKYSIYGHSAGGQFVHRFVEFLPKARIQRAVAANAGYYTLPDTTEDPYPFSRTGTPKESEAERRDIFAQNMIILLGEADTDPNDPDLYHSPEVDKQGMYRLARGQYFFQKAQEMARRDNLPLKWHIETVPGVGHSNEKMAPAAAKVLFE